MNDQPVISASSSVQNNNETGHGLKFNALINVKSPSLFDDVVRVDHQHGIIFHFLLCLLTPNTRTQGNDHFVLRRRNRENQLINCNH